MIKILGITLMLAVSAYAADGQDPENTVPEKIKDGKITETPVKIKPSKVLSYKPATDKDGKPLMSENGKPMLKLRLHIFNPPDLKVTDKRPAIIFFFGGGWLGGKIEQFYPHCSYLASRGMVAIATDYRVEKIHHTTPKECVKDAKSAIRWVRQHAGELGVDPDKLAAGGGSAGGHIAAAAATLKGFDEAGEDLKISARPDALVLFNPVYDNGPEGYGYDRVKDYWREFSPMNNLSKSTPPTVVFLGTKDKWVPVATAEKFKKMMEANGCRSDLHVYEGQEHGFWNVRNPEYYFKTVVEMDRFLVSLGYLKGEPTLKAPSSEEIKNPVKQEP